MGTPLWIKIGTNILLTAANLSVPIVVALWLRPSDWPAPEVVLGVVAAYILLNPPIKVQI